MDSTLAKGLSVFEWLVHQREGRVSEVAKALGLGRSNAHRTLQTLVECGWATQDPTTSVYRPGIKLFELGALLEESVDLRVLLRPVLNELATQTGETIHLAALDGGDIVYLDKFDSPLPVAAYSRVGGRAPAYCVASGKALLSALNEPRDALAKRLGKLTAHTPHTITQLNVLIQQLDKARERGWSENKEEWRIGVCGLGAPVFNARGEPVAAVGLSAPSIRFTRSHARVLGEQVHACARAASQILGFKPLPVGKPTRTSKTNRRQT